VMTEHTAAESDVSGEDAAATAVEAAGAGCVGAGAEPAGADPTGAESTEAGSAGVGSAARADPPRLGPRPLERPTVDPASATIYGRPDGIDGGFEAPPGSNGSAHRGAASAHNRTAHIGTAHNGAAAHKGAAQNGSAQGGSAKGRSGPVPQAALVTAYGRPEAAGEALQRPPRSAGAYGPVDPAFWDANAAADPWRNPESSVGLGPPAATETRAPQAALGAGARLSLRELLFGGRVHSRALAVLAAVAVLIGAAGGLVGRLTAEDASRLTSPDPTITQAIAAKERPAGSVADIAQRTVPAVVSIEVKVGDQGGTGSGVVIDPAGYVITNNHVVAPAADTSGAIIDAVFHDGTRVAARIVGRDPKTDLAVLKVDVANPVVATIGSATSLAVGDGVIAIGSPLGLAGTVTSGIVSALHRPVRLDGTGDTVAVIDAIQTDAAINPGNSGGALVDSTGAVVGINTAIRSLGQNQGEGGSIGLGFAIPIEDARAIADELIRTGTVSHAEIGINARSVSDSATDGAQVQNVQAGGAAAVAGIAEGDVIVKVGDRTIGGADELVVAVRAHQPGDVVPVMLVRDSRTLTVSVTLTAD
jgi:S1-C subfamily serine protease